MGLTCASSLLSELDRDNFQPIVHQRRGHRRETSIPACHVAGAHRWNSPTGGLVCLVADGLPSFFLRGYRIVQLFIDKIVKGERRSRCALLLATFSQPVASFW
jgi:hypothetical protein